MIIYGNMHVEHFIVCNFNDIKQQIKHVLINKNNGYIGQLMRICCLKNRNIPNNTIVFIRDAYTTIPNSLDKKMMINFSNNKEKKYLFGYHPDYNYDRHYRGFSFYQSKGCIFLDIWHLKKMMKNAYLMIKHGIIHLDLYLIIILKKKILSIIY